MGGDYTIKMPAVKIPPLLRYHLAPSTLMRALPVTSRSAKPLKRAVHQIARYFRREFEYDFVLYDMDERDSDHVAFLFPENEDEDLISFPTATVSACCFRWRQWDNAPHGWALQWIWLHPYKRDKGILRELWSTFRYLFGDFHPEPPLSKAMAGFLAKYPSLEPTNVPHLEEYLRKVAKHPRFFTPR